MRLCDALNCAIFCIHLLEAVIVFRQSWHRPRLPRLPQPQRQAVSKLSFQSGGELEFPLSSKKKSMLRIPDLLKENGILMVTNEF